MSNVATGAERAMAPELGRERSGAVAERAGGRMAGAGNHLRELTAERLDPPGRVATLTAALEGMLERRQQKAG